MEHACWKADPYLSFPSLSSQKSKKWNASLGIWGEFDSSKRLGVTGENEPGIKRDTSTFVFELSNSNTYLLRSVNGESCGGFSTCPTRFDGPCSLCSSLPNNGYRGPGSFHFRLVSFSSNLLGHWFGPMDLPEQLLEILKKCASPMLEHIFRPAK